MKEELEQIDRLIQKTRYIVDFLPEQAPKGAGGQFFDVEDYLLGSRWRFALRDRFAGILLRLMCYVYMSVFQGEWIDNPSPAAVDRAVGEIMESRRGTLYVLLPEEETLLVLDGDCLHLSVYNPPERVRALMERLALSEGLFWRAVTGIKQGRALFTLGSVAGGKYRFFTDTHFKRGCFC